MPRSCTGRQPRKSWNAAYRRLTSRRLRIERLDQRRVLAAGVLDPSFSGDGIATADMQFFDNAHSVAVQSDGKIVSAGTLNGGSGLSIGVVRYNANGALDSTFGTGGKVQTSFAGFEETTNSVAVAADGKILVAGTASSGGGSDFFVARYNANGSIDTTFGGNGHVVIGMGTLRQTHGLSLAVQSTGKVIVGGMYEGGFALARLSANGALDITFDGDGKLESTFGTAVESLVLLPDGKILAAGYGGNDFAIAKFNSNGSYDTTFDGDGRATIDLRGGFDRAHAMAVQADGRIVLAGSALVGNSGVEQFAVVRLLPTGGLDTTFDIDGKVTTTLGPINNSANSVLVQSNGRIVVVGQVFDSSHFSYDTALIRYESDGSLDTSFDGDGYTIVDVSGSLSNDLGQAAALVPGGNIVVVGSVSPNGSDFFAAEFIGDPDYQSPSDRDTTFARAGVSKVEFNNVADTSAEIIADSAQQPDGKIVFVKDHVVARLNTDGSPDASFGLGGGKYFNGFATSLAIQPDGKIMVAGYKDSLFVTNNPYVAVGRYNADGSLDSTFGYSVGYIEHGFAGENVSNVSIALQSDGKYIVSGNVSGGSGEFRYTRVFVLRLNSFGFLDTTFDGDGISRPTLPSNFAQAAAVAVQSDGKIVVGGSIDMFATNTDFLALRLNTNGSLDTSFDGDGIAIVNLAPAGTDTVYDLALQVDGRIILGGATNYGSGNGVTDFAIVRLTTSGAVDTSFDSDGLVLTNFLGPGAAQTVRSLAIQSDGRIVAAGIANSLVAIARYEVNGSLDNSFATNGRYLSSLVYSTLAPGSYLTAYSVSVQANGKIVTGGGFYDGGSFDYALMRLDPSGALDTSFDYTLANDGYVVHDFNFSSDIVSAMAIQPDGKILTAGYVYNGSNYDFGIARFNIDGSLDPSFDGDGKVVTALGTGDDVITAMAVTADGRIVVVGYAGAGVRLIVVAVYTSTGQLDSSFSDDGVLALPVGGFDEKAYAVAVQADGNFLIGGTTNLGGTPQSVIMRLTPNGNLDSSWSGGGLIIPGIGATVYAIKTLADGKFLAIGNEVSSDAGNFALARFNANGTLDTSFDGDGKVTTDMAGLGDVAYAAELQADGKIVVVGVANTGAVRGLAIARYNVDGSLDSSFDGDGKIVNAVGTADNYATSVTIQRNGKIIVGGLTRMQGGISTGVLMRLTSTGSLDTTFDGDGIRLGNIDGRDNVISAVALGNDGRLYAAGYADTGNFRTDGSNYDFTLERLYADSVDVAVVSATTNGLDQLTITYNVTGRNAAPFFVGVYLSPDTAASGYQNAGNDTFISRRIISRAPNLTVGLHRVTFTISATGLLLPDLTAAPTAALLDQRLLIVLDDNNQLGEMDGSTFAEDNTISFQGAYHRPGGTVVAFGTEGADTISVTQVGTQLRLALPGGVAYNYAPTDVSQFVIRGLAGDDRLQATNIAKPMVLVGGTGNDTLIGGSANDFLYGFHGADSMTGGGGNDGLNGGDSNDTYNFGNAVGSEVDTVSEAVNGGSDTLTFATLTIATGITVNLSTAGVAVGTHAGRTLNVAAGGQAAFLENVIGSIGNDTLTGNAAANVLRGGDGNDVISGGGANDVLDGGNGNDSLNGGTGNDNLEGGAGNDTLNGGEGSDRYVFKTASSVEVDTLFELAGGGVDWLDFSTLLSNDAINIDLGAAGTTIGTHNNRTINVGSAGGGVFFENVTGGAGNDTLRGNSAANRLEGGLGNDLLDGRLGTDTLDGGPGTDTALGGEILLNIP